MLLIVTNWKAKVLTIPAVITRSEPARLLLTIAGPAIAIACTSLAIIAAAAVGPAGNENQIDVQAVFSKQPGFFGDPDRRVSAGLGAVADDHFLQCWLRQDRLSGDERRQEELKTSMTACRSESHFVVNYVRSAHPQSSGARPNHPASRLTWIPACAGMTNQEATLSSLPLCGSIHKVMR